MSAATHPLLRVDRVVKTYESTAGPVHAVQSLSFDLERGAFAALVGPSGCGKTTLLNAIGGLDRVTSGQIWIDGTEITALNDRDTIEFRLHRIGFVFQAYNLVPVLNAWENVAFVLELQGVGIKARRDRAYELLAAVGLTGKELQRPSQLSGGQQQRVAVARALASRPSLILADEPTANLDSKSTETLLDIMHELNRQEGTTFLFSTHDQRVIDRAERLFRLEDGKLVPGN
jgi:putative ABC transport system ATP-binding protein